MKKSFFMILTSLFLVAGCESEGSQTSKAENTKTEAIQKEDKFEIEIKNVNKHYTETTNTYDVKVDFVIVNYPDTTENITAKICINGNETILYGDALRLNKDKSAYSISAILELNKSSHHIYKDDPIMLEISDENHTIILEEI